MKFFAVFCAVVCAIFFCVAVAAAPLAPVAARAAALVEEGKALYRDKNYVGAFTRFRAAADADPENATALYNAALAARKAGLQEEARTAYVDLLKRAPDDLDAVYGLAEVERALDHKEAARALYERFVRDEKRAERQELVARATAVLATLPAAPAIASPTANAAAQDVDAAKAAFADGLALLKREQFGEAAARFATAFDLDPNRFDALLKRGLALRKAMQLDASQKAYEQVLGAVAASNENRWDATYGLAETERLRGDKVRAADLFTSYAAAEQRAAEARYVKRAREMAAQLRAELAALPVAVTTPVAPAASIAAVPSSVTLAVSPSLPFTGDALAVDELVAAATAADAAGRADDARALWARARSLAPGDARLPPAAGAPAVACDADRLLAAGEVALANNNAADAIAAFRQARVCDPKRAAPLWGLSRGFDAVGAHKQARHNAALYAQSTAADRDPTAANAALWRSEQPE